MGTEGYAAPEYIMTGNNNYFKFSISLKFRVLKLSCDAVLNFRSSDDNERRIQLWGSALRASDWTAVDGQKPAEQREEPGGVVTAIFERSPEG